MKEKILLYGICAAISVVAVAVTSLVKLIACSFAKKCGKDLSGNVKEYVFTPMALIIAAAGLYIWLDEFIGLEINEQFILIIVLFSLATMLVYWLLFQPTRKFAMRIIRSIAKRANVDDVLNTVEEIISDTVPGLLQSQETVLQSNAVETEESPPAVDNPQMCETTEATAEDKLRAMVESIVNK